jgi:hypothetical protein
VTLLELGVVGSSATLLTLGITLLISDLVEYLWRRL